MKILHVNASYKPAWIYGGPTVSVSMLCEALAKAGVEVNVFTTTANGANELEVITNKPVQIDGVTVTYYKRITKDHTHFSPALLWKLWRSAKQYDAIHVHGWWNTVSVLACAVAVWKKVPLVVSPRGMLSDYSFENRNSGTKGIIHKLFGKRLLEKAFIHTTAESEQSEIKKIASVKNFGTIANIIQLPDTIPAKPDENGIFKIIFLSRIDPKKGIEYLIEALANITQPWHLTVAGTGDGEYIDRLKTKANELKISANITWAGFAGDEKFELLSRHDLFVLPSHNENFGNAVIESLSVGTAVLISRGVGLRKYVSSNRLGWIHLPSEKSLSEKLTDIMLNKQDQLNEIRTSAPGIIRKDFSGECLVQFYINLYKHAKFFNGRI